MHLQFTGVVMNYVTVGRLIEYKTASGWLINADCNGAANILAKVATQLGLSLVEVGRGSLTLPQRIDLFTRLNKSYRKRCRARLVAAPCNNSLESPVFPTGGDVKTEEAKKLLSTNRRSEGV